MSKKSSTKVKYKGIPEDLTLDAARKWAKPRVTEKRFRHIEGVAAAGKEIAELAGEDEFLSELAGWLHDGCKEWKDKELVKAAQSYGLILNDIERENGHLLHGPVAAFVARDELNIKHQDLLDAVAEHTLGKVGMTNLSKIVFLADCLEESRPKDFTDPIWNALKNNPNKKADLDAAMLVACDLSLEHLIKSGRVIHIKTVDVRNYFLSLVKER
ncbi:MAG: HD domain-containing protein [Candidatus Melainabacteria bacterium]|nr:MAG: HD domain-containing protein [Candidatus Melainabacteria bacterium]